MQKIDVVGKWDLNLNCWRDPHSFIERQKSLTVVSYEDMVNYETDGYDYIIIADGTRLENHSKDGINTRINGAVKNVLEYFSRKKKNFKFRLILLDNDAPLKEESKWIANYLDTIARLSDVKSISYIGISKCGVMAFDLIKYLHSVEALSKVRVYSLSSPYGGTLLASPLYIEAEIKKILAAKITSKTLQDLILTSLMKLVEGISSNSHMDYDIALPGGAKDLYDPSFIGDIISPANLNPLNKVADFKNISTVIDEKVRQDVNKSFNLLGIGLCLLDSYFYQGNSDGLVLLSSQRMIDEFYKPSIILNSFHNPLECEPYASQVLDMVWDNIGCEDSDLKKQRTH